MLGSTRPCQALQDNIRSYKARPQMHGQGNNDFVTLNSRLSVQFCSIRNKFCSRTFSAPLGTFFVRFGTNFVREHFSFHLYHFYSCFHANNNNKASFRTFEQSSRSKIQQTKLSYFCLFSSSPSIGFVFQISFYQTFT